RTWARALRAASIEALEIAADRRDPDEVTLRRRLDGLGETALMIEDWIDRHDGAELVSVTGQAFSTRVFEAQIATEQLAGALWSLRGESRRPAGLVRAMNSLSVVLHDRPTVGELRAARDVAAAASREADPATPSGLATMVAYRAVQAHVSIHRIAVRAASLFPGSGWRIRPRSSGETGRTR